jgi:glycosyltransferase involved in cell wall biosynthesis
MTRTAAASACQSVPDGTRAAGPRILHAPADVGGHAYGLSRAERELGLRSDVAVLAPGPFGYEADIRFDLASAPAWRQLTVRTRLVLRALRDYDVIHFNFGQSIIPVHIFGRILNELPLIRRAGKTILVTFQGCDVRPQSQCFCTQEHCRRETPWRAPNAARFLRYADRCFHLNPDLAPLLPGSRFLPYASVDPRSVRPSAGVARTEDIVVAHAPSNREVKGTRYLIRAIEELAADGVRVHLDLIEGVPRAEVLERLRAADIVVDQLLIGWYGGLAVEAMALGKPVVCHIREDPPQENPFGDELPIVRADRGSLAARLRELIDDREARRRVGVAGRAFVERRHDPRVIAREVLSDVLPRARGVAGER